MSMGMSMSMGVYQTQSLRQEQVCIATLPPVNWSLLRAFGRDRRRGFVVKRARAGGYDELDHESRMKLIDQANEVFRFVYTRGTNERTGKQRDYFKVPLVRNRNIEPDEIKIRISAAAYERATAIVANTGEMERIARAIPYHGLLVTVREHLATAHKVSLEDAVLVGVDRGGRLPAIILGRALDCKDVFFLKVDQGGKALDEEHLSEFAAAGSFRGKHVLFVDSTVDSGRQIQVLREYFDNEQWRQNLGHRSWSIVGSNENGKCLYKHLDVNWGVDPDETFEDNPLLMGVDYAPGCLTKVVEKPSKTSRKIRKIILDVPDGFVFDLSDVSEQIAAQRKKAYEARAQKKLCYEAELEYVRIIATKLWQDATKKKGAAPCASLPQVIPNGVPHQFRNILVIGSGKATDIPQQAANLVADSLGTHNSFFAGTPDGNPGMVLKTILGRVTNPEVRLYQPGRRKGKTVDSFGGAPVIFAGKLKEEMRYKMVKDSHVALVFGGAEGTLREVLLLLRCGKPVVVIKGWGAIPTYLLASKKFSVSPHIKMCEGVAEAIQAVLELTKA